MKNFTIQEQIYICKNANSKTLERLAIATTSTIKEVKTEFENMKIDGRFEKYRKMTDEEIEKFINEQQTNKKEDKEEDEQNNTLLELNNLLFNELRTLRDDSLSEEQFNREKIKDKLKYLSYDMGEGFKMCKYCEIKSDDGKEINGREFKLLHTHGFKNDRKYSSWILKHTRDIKAGIMIATNNSNAVYFNINYCPICGRKLG